jgi:hypothetical protein
VLDRAGAGAEDTERLIAHLPAVAVGAMKEVASPTLPDSRNLRQFVRRARGDQEPSRLQRPASCKTDCEAGLDRDDGAREQLDAVGGRLFATRSSNSCGGIPSRERKPCMCAAGAFRGAPESTTTTRRRARPRTRAALRPAAPPPTMPTSYGASFIACGDPTGLTTVG